MILGDVVKSPIALVFFDPDCKYHVVDAGFVESVLFGYGVEHGCGEFADGGWCGGIKRAKWSWGLEMCTL